MGPRAIATAALLLVLAITALAQSRRIEGVVTDGEGRPVAGAAVSVTLVARFCVSCPDGEQAIDSPAPHALTQTDERGAYAVAVGTAGVFLVRATSESAGSGTREVALAGSFGQSNPDIMRPAIAVANVTLERTVAVQPDAGCSTRSSAPASRRHVLAAAAQPELERLLLWLKAAGSHAPGCLDGYAAEVARFSRSNLEELLRDVRQLVRFLQRTRTPGGPFIESNRAVFSLYGRQFTLDELERVFHAQRALHPDSLLVRGAVLHADIAVLVPGNLSGEPLVSDGGQKGWRAATSHWDVGRRLLDSIAPRPAENPDAELWYRAVSAYLLDGGYLSEALAHLTKSRQVFPGNPAFLLDSALLHEKFASPSLQASADALRADGIDVNVASSRVEWRRAERFFRDAVARGTDDAETHLRLGHVLIELGDHEQAAVWLRAALEAGPDRRQRYLAELFLGRVEQRLGRLNEAAGRYRNAATIYPAAQAPRFGMSQLEWQAGNRAGALGALFSDLPASSSAERDDPWFEYYNPHRHDADRLMREMRTSAGER